MKAMTSYPKTTLFLDDGYPEARDYDDNYRVLEPGQPDGWIRPPAVSEPAVPQGPWLSEEDSILRPRLPVRSAMPTGLAEPAAVA